jgi:hypothetical protein
LAYRWILAERRFIRSCTEVGWERSVSSTECVRNGEERMGGGMWRSSTEETEGMA